MFKHAYILTHEETWTITQTHSFTHDKFSTVRTKEKFHNVLPSCKKLATTARK